MNGGWNEPLITTETASGAARKERSSVSMATLNALDAAASPNGAAEIELIDRVIIGVAARFRIQLATLFKRSRRREICMPRYAVVLIAFRAGYTQAEIATALNQERTTIYTSLERADDFMKRYPRFRQVVERVRGECGLL